MNIIMGSLFGIIQMHVYLSTLYLCDTGYVESLHQLHTVHPELETKLKLYKAPS